MTQRLSQLEVQFDLHAAERSTDAAGDRPIFLRMMDFVVTTPHERSLVRVPSLEVNRGDRLLICGRSGVGKTSLLRAMSGLWPFTSGQLWGRPDLNMLVLPQRPYLPMGTLKDALAYPDSVSSLRDADFDAALTDVGLGNLANALDKNEAWDQSLSEGEKQRLSFARALILRPDLLCLDEVGAALGDQVEFELHRLLHQRLSDSAIVAVSHNERLRELYQQRLVLISAES